MAAAQRFYENERVALFIDGANLYSAARALEFDIDYKRLLEYFRENANLVRAFYYTALIEDQEYSPIRPLVDWLDYNGYTMVTKPTKEFTDSQGRRKIKGNMDIELAVDMMDLAERILANLEDKIARENPPPRRRPRDDDDYDDEEFHDDDEDFDDKPVRARG